MIIILLRTIVIKTCLKDNILNKCLGRITMEYSDRFTGYVKFLSEKENVVDIIKDNYTRFYGKKGCHEKKYYHSNFNCYGGYNGHNRAYNSLWSGII